MTLPDVTLHLPDGTPTTLGAHAADPLVVVLVRYFGCLPCQEFLLALDARRHELAAGAAVVAIGGSADYQATWLAETKGVTMPLLLDAEQQVRRAVDLPDLTARQMVSARGARNYLGSLGGGLRPQRPTRDALRAPGVVLLGPDLALLWAHRGAFLGDYPTPDRVLEAAATLATGS